MLVLLLGLAVTAAVTWIAQIQYSNAEHRLLLVQTKQAGLVIQSAIPSTEIPLATAAQLARATAGNVVVFRRYMHPFVGGPTGFLVASLWEVRGGEVRLRSWLGDPGAARPAGTDVRATGARALAIRTFVVRGRLDQRLRRLDYVDALRSGGTEYVVFTERTLPRNRRSRVASGSSAFSDLLYAIYLGPSPLPHELLSTDFPGGVPSGSTAKVTVPFGDTSLTLVGAAAAPLSGSEPARLPWILATFGIVLSALAALLAQRGVNRRRAAEHDAAEIAVLNHELSDLYAEQRTIAVTLQRSLLPVATPSVPGVEVAVRYLPGGEGLEVGGDWYSVVSMDDRRFAVVVGDVSGRGVRAAAVMAGLRFTIRTLLLEGNAPDEALAKCAAQTKDLAQGHLATVLLGIGDPSARTLSLASAGHLRPLLVAGGTARYLDVTVGVPLGAPDGRYEVTTVEIPLGATLLFFTDGLVERRGEHLDVGFARLAAAAVAAPSGLEAFLTSVCDQLTLDADEDDVALLAMRWGDPPA